MRTILEINFDTYWLCMIHGFATTVANRCLRAMKIKTFSFHRPMKNIVNFDVSKNNRNPVNLYPIFKKG